MSNEDSAKLFNERLQNFMEENMDLVGNMVDEGYKISIIVEKKKENETKLQR